MRGVACPEVYDYLLPPPPKFKSRIFWLARRCARKIRQTGKGFLAGRGRIATAGEGTRGGMVLPADLKHALVAVNVTQGKVGKRAR